MLQHARDASIGPCEYDERKRQPLPRCATVALPMLMRTPWSLAPPPATNKTRRTTVNASSGRHVDDALHDLPPQAQQFLLPKYSHVTAQKGIHLCLQGVGSSQYELASQFSKKAPEVL